jgi:hypothetical protein
MSGSGLRRSLGALAAAAFLVAVTACGPGDTGAAGLQSVAAGSTSSAVSPTAPSATAAPLTSATVTASAPASSAPTSPVEPSSSPATAKPATPEPAPPKPTAAGPSPKPAPPQPAATALTASVGGGPIRYGDQSAFTVTVRPARAVGDLTGHVTVRDGAAVVAEGDTDAAGSAALGFLNTADPGTKTYRVSYSGNATAAGSTVDLPVQTTQTNVDITIDWPQDAAPGKDVTITADIIGTPQTPTGKATISVDGAPITSAAIADDGTISGTAKAVAAGDHAVEVSYAGDVRFEANTASATLSIRQAPVNPNQAGADAAQASNPCPAAASACVDLSGQQAWLQSAGKITYGPVPITSGREGHRTRTGMFSVFWRDKDHLSSLFNDAPMPNSVFFDDGIAFHEGSLSDQSHGCIHLSWDASETFYDTLSVGDNVYVWGAPPY